MIKFMNENNCYAKYQCFGNSIFIIPVDNKKFEKKKNKISLKIKEKNETSSDDSFYNNNDGSNLIIKDINIYFTKNLINNWKYKIYQLKISCINTIKNVLN
jgi:hypothetical protein